MRKKPPGPGLLKMSALARLSGVPAATIKFYLREGLLPASPVRTSPNMAYYDASLVPRIKAIKELQRTRFLPLRLIRGLLDDMPPLADEKAATEAIARVLRSAEVSESATRAELVANGMPAAELDWLEQARLVTPTGQGDERTYRGDDLALVRTLRDARVSGLTYEMLPFEILEGYQGAIREMVRFEMDLLQRGIVPRAGPDAPRLAEAATRLSERLVVLMRRKLIAEMEGELPAAPPPRPPARRARPTGRTRGR
jgi:DNA-binding transcriptional MerR regulator